MNKEKLGQMHIKIKNVSTAICYYINQNLTNILIGLYDLCTQIRIGFGLYGFVVESCLLQSLAEIISSEVIV